MRTKRRAGLARIRYPFPSTNPTSTIIPITTSTINKRQPIVPRLQRHRSRINKINPTRTRRNRHLHRSPTNRQIRLTIQIRINRSPRITTTTISRNISRQLRNSPRAVSWKSPAVLAAPAPVPITLLPTDEDPKSTARRRRPKSTARRLRINGIGRINTNQVSPIRMRTKRRAGFARIRYPFPSTNPTSTIIPITTSTINKRQPIITRLQRHRSRINKINPTRTRRNRHLHRSPTNRQIRLTIQIRINRSPRKTTTTISRNISRQLRNSP